MDSASSSYIVALTVFSRDVVDWRGSGGDGAASTLSIVVLRKAVEVDVYFHVERLMLLHRLGLRYS